MRRTILLFGVVVGVVCLCAGVEAGVAPDGNEPTWQFPVNGFGGPWSDGFDDYDDGSEIVGQGGWEGWWNDAGVGATVTSARAQAGPHSLLIAGASDVVQQFSMDSGQWTLQAWHYLARDDHTGDTYYIMNNEYDADARSATWAIQMQFDISTGTVIDDLRGGSLPIAYDQWALIEIDIDLDNNTQETRYNGDVLSGSVWTSEGGAVAIAAIDLFSNGPTAYFDTLSLVPEPASVLLLVGGAAAVFRRRKAQC